MSGKSEATLAHIYGIAGLIPGLVSLFYLIHSDANWKEYSLVGSGWLAALIYALMLWRCFAQSRKDGEQIGKLTQELISEREISKRDKKIIQSELEQNKAILEFLVSLHIGTPATPRATVLEDEQKPTESKE